MNDTRARFEEIWPVPSCLYWNHEVGEYRPNLWHDASATVCGEYTARLETFTRCQEATDVYVSLVDEMVAELKSCYECLEGFGYANHTDILDRANQIMGDKK